ncbi:MAG: type IA DNA topoisomerase [Lachnospiraceae bacterium]|nr:type IA DNA topoisomerase [Lachnospiraceae bacterium]
MGKSLYIAEKPSVAREFASALRVRGRNDDGFIESDDAIITWCLGHLVSMSYPDKYDPALKRWTLETLPFIPDVYKYEVISSSKKQYSVVKKLLNRTDVDTVYVCTDSGREGEYIYRLVEQMAGVKTKDRRRVWIDSQTEEEILKGIREAKPLSAYDNLADSAYLRAKEDYLMGINFSRLLTIRYANQLGACMGGRTPISVGRVMTCVLGMVVRREREIRDFVPTPFYRVAALIAHPERVIDAEWKAVEGSEYFESPLLYKENGFAKKEDAEEMVRKLRESGEPAVLLKKSDREEKKNAPLLYNLAELQNDCSRLFKISPDETLKIAQELYEKKLTTYPRTDARVLSSAVAKEIGKNISGLQGLDFAGGFAKEILANGSYKNIAKTRYVNDSQITDHYAIVPTGQTGAARSLSPRSAAVYELIVRRFLSIFYPPAVYRKLNLEFTIGREHFFASMRALKEEGWLAVARRPKKGAGEEDSDGPGDDLSDASVDGSSEDGEGAAADIDLIGRLASIKKGESFPVNAFELRESQTSPPKRYTSGSMILAMENAGKLIEDPDLREQIKGSGIGTSATRAEILKKLVNNEYLALSKKTQVITPTLMGEVIFDIVRNSIPSLLNPELTASWEKGLSYVAEGSIGTEEYLEKLTAYIRKRFDVLEQYGGRINVRALYDASRQFYPEKKQKLSQAKRGNGRSGGRPKSGKASGGKPAEDRAE